jgi:hypothetical protein
MTNDAGGRGRRASALLIGVCLLHLACPYDAPIEPAGTVLPLRSFLVGTWLCSTEEEQGWATLSLGWQGSSAYQLTLRPTKPLEPGAAEPSLIVYAKPRRIGGREIWSIWTDDSGDPAQTFSFFRVEVASADRLTLSSLGDGTALPARLAGESPDSLAKILADPKETVAEGPVTCRRTNVAWIGRSTGSG